MSHKYLGYFSLYASEPPLRICVYLNRFFAPQSTFFKSCQVCFPGLKQYLAGINMSCSRAQRSAAGEARARSPSISNQALLTCSVFDYRTHQEFVDYRTHQDNVGCLVEVNVQVQYGIRVYWRERERERERERVLNRLVKFCTVTAYSTCAVILSGTRARQSGYILLCSC